MLYILNSVVTPCGVVRNDYPDCKMNLAFQKLAWIYNFGKVKFLNGKMPGIASNPSSNTKQLSFV